MDNELLKTLRFISSGNRSIVEVMAFLGVSYIGFIKIYGDYVGKYFYCNFETHPGSKESILHITEKGRALVNLPAKKSMDTLSEN